MDNQKPEGLEDELQLIISGLQLSNSYKDERIAELEGAYIQLQQQLDHLQQLHAMDNAAHQVQEARRTSHVGTTLASPSLPGTPPDFQTPRSAGPHTGPFMGPHTLVNSQDYPLESHGPHASPTALRSAHSSPIRHARSPGPPKGPSAGAPGLPHSPTTVSPTWHAEYEAVQFESPTRRGHNDTLQDALSDALQQNGQLRGRIARMCWDMEALSQQEQQHRQQLERQLDKAHHEAQQLKKQLQVASSSCSRLRRENERLMDLSNALRAERDRMLLAIGQHTLLEDAEGAPGAPWSDESDSQTDGKSSSSSSCATPVAASLQHRSNNSLPHERTQPLMKQQQHSPPPNPVSKLQNSSQAAQGGGPRGPLQDPVDPGGTLHAVAVELQPPGRCRNRREPLHSVGPRAKPFLQSGRRGSKRSTSPGPTLKPRNFNVKEDTACGGV